MCFKKNKGGREAVKLQHTLPALPICFFHFFNSLTERRRKKIAIPSLNRKGSYTLLCYKWCSGSVIKKGTSRFCVSLSNHLSYTLQPFSCSDMNWILRKFLLWIFFPRLIRKWETLLRLQKEILKHLKTRRRNRCLLHSFKKKKIFRKLQVSSCHTISCSQHPRNVFTFFLDFTQWWDSATSHQFCTNSS